MTVAVALLGAITTAVERTESLDLRWLLAALVLQVGSLAFLGFAWRNILAAAYPGRVPIFSVVAAYVAGAALNGFVPARAGEGAKVALARARIPGSRFATIAGSLSVLLLADGVLGAGVGGALWATGVLPTVPVPLPNWGAAPRVISGALLALAVAVVGRFGLVRLRSLLASILDGLMVLRSPAGYLCRVLPFQIGGWTCRISVVYFLLHAFHIDASLATVLLVVVLSGASTAVPAPGGGGSQQILSIYALHGTISAGGALSFSLVMQVGVTAVNTAVGLAAAMLLVRSRPLAALRSARA